MNQKQQQIGAGSIEAVIFLPIIFVTCLLTLQMMLLYRAKIALNYATQEGARVGSMANGRFVPRFLTDVTAMMTGTFSKGGGAKAVSLGAEGEKSSDGGKPDTKPSAGGDSAGKPAAAPQKGDNFKKFGRGLMRYGDSSVLQGYINGLAPLYTRGTDFTDVVKGQLEAYKDGMMNSCIVYHNPTLASFVDFGFVEVEGVDRMVLQIPVDAMRYRIPARVDMGGKHSGYFKSKGKSLSDEEVGIKGRTSDASIQDATLLSIEAKYSYEMQVPLAREIIIGITKLYNKVSDTKESAMTKAFNDSAMEKGRWPMSSFATYRMQTPVHFHILYPLGGRADSVGNIPGFDLIPKIWNMVQDAAGPGVDLSEPQIGFCPGLLLEKLGAGSKKKINEHWVGEDYDRRLQSTP